MKQIIKITKEEAELIEDLFILLILETELKQILNW